MPPPKDLTFPFFVIILKGTFGVTRKAVTPAQHPPKRAAHIGASAAADGGAKTVRRAKAAPARYSGTKRANLTIREHGWNRGSVNYRPEVI